MPVLAALPPMWPAAPVVASAGAVGFLLTMTLKSPGVGDFREETPNEIS